MEYTAFVGNHLILDKFVYQLWLLGFNVEQAIVVALQRRKDPASTAAAISNLLNTSQSTGPSLGNERASSTSGAERLLDRGISSNIVSHSAGYLSPTSAPSLTSSLSGSLPLNAATRQNSTSTHSGYVGPELYHPDVIRSFITSQYRNFELLEQFLHRPKLIHSQLLFSLQAETKSYLIHKYYGFEEKVVREFLGKKLTSRARKELDDVCAKTRVPIVGCRRMFDNLKRIMKKVEDGEGFIVDIIMQDFLIPKELASQYAHVIFINNYRLDTTKKKLAHLHYRDFEYVASILSQHLTTSPSSVLEELDSSVAQDSRDLKAILFAGKDIMEDFRSSVATKLASQSIMEKGGQGAFKMVIKNILNIGSGLANSKELRDILQSIMEKVVEPSIGVGWSPSDLDALLSAAIELFPNVNSVSPNFRRKYQRSFERIVTAIKLIAIRFTQETLKAAGI